MLLVELELIFELSQLFYFLIVFLVYMQLALGLWCYNYMRTWIFCITMIYRSPAPHFKQTRLLLITDVLEDIKMYLY